MSKERSTRLDTLENQLDTLEKKRFADFSLQNQNAMRVYKLISLVAFIAAWQLLDLVNGHFNFYNPLLFPSPLDIATRAAALWSTGVL